MHLGKRQKYVVLAAARAGKSAKTDSRQHTETELQLISQKIALNQIIDLLPFTETVDMTVSLSSFKFII